VIKLTPKRAGIVCWILKNKDREWSIHEIYNELQTPWYNSTRLFVKKLENAGYVAKMGSGLYRVMDVNALIQQISLLFPFRAKEKIVFFSHEPRERRMKTIDKMSLDYAFTAFTAGELITPYVMMDKVYAYIRKTDIDKWKKKLLQKSVWRTEEAEGNLFLLPVEEDYVFKLSRKIERYTIAPMGLVLADMYSIGGLGEEHAMMIQKEWIKK
jgi:hypothetical protein